MLAASNMHDFTPTSHSSKRSHTFSHFLKRKLRSPGKKHHEPSPPTPPPKDRSTTQGHYLKHSRIVTEPTVRSTSLDSNSLSYFYSFTPDPVISPPIPPPKSSVSLPPVPTTPADRARYREEARLRREQEELEMALEEEARQAQALRQKQKMDLEAAQEEERRKAQLAHDLERAKLERERRMQLEKAEQEWAHKQAQERKLQAKQRRLDEGRRMQEWRDEQERRRQEFEQEKEEENRKYQQEWQERIQIAGDSINETSMREGWVTIQTSPTTPWRRRWFKFVGQTVFFYRSPQDKHTSLDTLHLNRYSPLSLKYWRNPGYEELEAIDYSFALEFSSDTIDSDDSQYWSFFADTEQAKDHLLGLFCYFGNITPEPVSPISYRSKIPRWKEQQPIQQIF